MSQPPSEADNVLNTGTGSTLLLHDTVPTILTYHTHRRPPLSAPVGAESSVGTRCI